MALTALHLIYFDDQFQCFFLFFLWIYLTYAHSIHSFIFSSCIVKSITFFVSLVFEGVARKDGKENALKKIRSRQLEKKSLFGTHETLLQIGRVFIRCDLGSGIGNFISHPFWCLKCAQTYFFLFSIFRQLSLRHAPPLFSFLFSLYVLSHTSPSLFLLLLKNELLEK